MGITKKNIFIISLIVLCSLIFNIVIYFRNEIKYPLFYYHYTQTDGNFFQLQYLRNINNTDRIFEITLPEYNDMPLLIEDNYNDMNFLSSNIYPNETQINSHYVLQKLTLSLPFEYTEFKDVFDSLNEKDIVVSKIRYRTSTGKTAIINIGKIIITNNPPLIIDQENFALSKGNVLDKDFLRNSYTSTKDFTLSYNVNEGLNSDLIKQGSLFINNTPLSKEEFSLLIKDNTDFTIDFKLDKNKNYFLNNYPITFNIKSQDGKAFKLYSYIRSDINNEISSKGINELRKLREGE